MMHLIIDETTSQTPIGELLQGGRDDVIELRSQSGELLGTLFLPDRSEDERYAELQEKFAEERDLLRARMARPITQGLTTTEFVERLQQLGSET